MEPQYLSPSQAAAYLGVNVKSIHKALAAGLAHSRLTPRLIRIARADLEAWRRTSNTKQ